MDTCLGIVVIGRNEGDRLRACFASLPMHACRVVYVDSGSTDGSLEAARGAGAHVVELDMSIPFTAGRARNAGLVALRLLSPAIEFVQFVDGDCELRKDWLRKALGFMRRHPRYGVVCGRVRERHPDSSVYNGLCDMEWNVPPGEAKACGGNALMRMSALRRVGGFRDELIAGEEPELCLRMRRAGCGVYRMAAEMVLHDAAMTRFSQWWKRTMRGGYAFAEGAWLHGRGPERHWVRESARAVAYGGVLPIATLLLLASGRHPWAWLLLLVYPAQVLRLIARDGQVVRSVYLVLARFPEFGGVAKFFATRLRGGSPRIIEYK
jgi:GT2 family glycosyltransferase